MPRKDSRSKSPSLNKSISFKEATTYKPFVPQINKTPTYLPKPTLFDSVKQGFGFGLGSSIAHKTVDSFMGSFNKVNSNCDSIKNEYNKCILDNKYDDSKNICLKLEKEYEQCTV